MKLILDIIGLVIILPLFAVFFTFLIWKLKGQNGRKDTFGKFFDKYGEFLTYAGLALITILIWLINR